MQIPLRWFASMWSCMVRIWPSIPHTLHISANWCPLLVLFWLFSIIDFTHSQSFSGSPEIVLGMANVLFSPGLWIWLPAICLLKGVFGTSVLTIDACRECLRQWLFVFFKILEHFIRFPHQALQLKFFSYSQEWIQILLENICFPTSQSSLAVRFTFLRYEIELGLRAVYSPR